eukprot:7185118-Alexandrium_andersonii.AAC.1
MSASLVGSEMCIRDSLNATSAPKGNYNTSDRLELEMPLIVAHHVETVSYTHLTLPTICSV